MTRVLLANEKHGTYVYASALACLRTRVEDGYWYGGEAAERARVIVLANDETLADGFLSDRSHAEYEGVQWATVIGAEP